jgi:outer membrane autotransporter protein
MKRELEKSLKRYLKRKIKVTLGLLVTFLITGEIGYSLEYADKLYNNIQDVVEDAEYKVKVGDQGVNYRYGIMVYNNSDLDIQSDNIEIINVSSGNEVEGKEVAAINLRMNSKLVLGTEETKNINLKVDTDKGGASAIYLYNDHRNGTDGGSSLEINGERLEINVHSEGTGANKAIFGIVVGTKVDYDGQNCVVDINSENTVVNVSSDSGLSYAANALVAWGGGTIRLNSGNVKISADNVINVKRNSFVEINANSLDNIIQLDGSIVFECVDPSTDIDSDVVVNLTNSNSYLNGNILVTNLVDGHSGTVDGMKLGLSNGATWSTTEEGSFVNYLTFNGGIINNNWDINNIGNIKGDRDYSMNIDNMTGTGGTIIMDATYDEVSDSFSSTTLEIKEKDNNTKLNFAYDGIDADNIAINDAQKTEEALNQLAENIYIRNGEINSSINVDEGLLNGAIVGDLVQGTSGMQVENIRVGSLSNTVMGLRNLATINLLTWRQEFSSFSQRMGELRDSQGNSGVWARVYGGEIEQGSNYDNSYQTYQVGYDKAYDYAGGKLFLGYLFSYTDGNTDYDLGSGENNSIGAGVYGSWFNNSGHYIDVVAKLSRLHNDYDVYSENRMYNSKGDYTNYGVSLGVEYGKRFVTDNKFFIEPSIRMDLGRVANKSYTTSTDVRVEQDTLYTALGSLGAKIGYNLEKGNLYARISGVKEFAGDIDTTYTNKFGQTKTSVDLEDEWIEFGIGGNYKVAENVNLYLDLSKTTEAMVDTNWQANLGFRWEL